MDLNQTKPKPKPRSRTNEITLRGRSVWIDETGEITGKKGTRYSEVSTTIPFGTGWITAPTIDENGNKLSDEEVKQRLKDNQGKDFITGEKLPVFSSEEKASEYAQWRSKTMFDKEAIKEGFPEETFPDLPEDKKEEDKEGQTSLKGFMEYLMTPSRHFGTGQYNEGGMAEQMEMFGYTDEGVQQEAEKFVDKDAAPAKDITFMDAAKFVAELTPVIGDAMAAKEVYDELQKEDPNYFLAGALGGAAIIGLIPGIGDAAASAIRAGARKSLDLAKRVEVDPDAVGAMGGNIRLKPKEEDYLTINNPNYKQLRGSADESVDRASAEKLFLSGDEEIEKVRKAQASSRKQEFAGERPFQESARKLEKDEITPKEFRREAFEDVEKFTEVEELPTFTEAVFSLDKQKRKEGILGLVATYKKGEPIIKKGSKVRARLDIPAYNNYDVYMPQIDFSGADGKGSMFARTMVIKNVNFSTNPEAAFNISRGAKTKVKNKKGEEDLRNITKYPHAYIMGEVAENPVTKSMFTDKEARDLALDAINSDDYLHLGYNPDRGGFFYDRQTKMPVFDSPFVIQIGKQVYAKKPPKWGSKVIPAERIKKIKKLQLKKFKDFEGETQTKEGRRILMNEGGVTMNEQMELALGDVPDNTVGIDPVSGNEIPLGSSAEEVRDDIPAMLSPGEIVIPADVVKFHGVKLFEELREEAKIGFAEMEADGRIGGQPIDEPDLPPDEEELLNEILAMEENTGVVEAAAGIYTPPNTSVLTTPTASQVPSTGTTPPSTQQVAPSSTTQQPNSVYGITTASGTPVTANTALVNKQPVVGNVDIANPTSSATTPATTTTPQTGMIVEQYVAPDCRRLEVLKLNGQIISTLPADFEVFVKATEESLKRFGCIPDDSTDTTTTDDTTITTTTKKDDDDDDDNKVVTTDPEFDLTTSKGSEAAADYFTKKSGVDVSDPFKAATNALNAASGSGLFGKGLGVVSLALGPVAMIGAGAVQVGSKLDALSTAFANLKMANYLGNTDMAKNIQTEIDKFLANSPKAVKFLSGLGDLGDKKFDYAMMAATSVNAPDNMALTQDRFATEEAFVASMNSTAQTGYKYDPTAGDDGKGAYVIDESQTVTIPSSDGSDSITVSAASAAASASSFEKDDDTGSIIFKPGEETVRPVIRPDPPGGGSSGSSAPVGVVGNNDTGSNSLAQNIANWTTPGDGMKYVNGVLVKESSSSSSSSSSDDKDDDDGTVICTVYSDTGYLSKDIWNLDKRYGALLYRNDPELMRGYHIWGVPFAKFLRKKTFTSKLFRKVMWPIVKAWAEEMAHNINPKKYKPNYFGKLIKAVGEPFSRLCALVTKAKRLEKGIL